MQSTIIKGISLLLGFIVLATIIAWWTISDGLLYRDSGSFISFLILAYLWALFSAWVFSRLTKNSSLKHKLGGYFTIIFIPLMLADMWNAIYIGLGHKLSSQKYIELELTLVEKSTPSNSSRWVCYGHMRFKEFDTGFCVKKKEWYISLQVGETLKVKGLESSYAFAPKVVAWPQI